MNDLKHFGVLGMRWGRRKSPAQELADRQKKYDKNLKNVSKQVDAYNRAADYANAVIIPKVNAKYAKYDFGSLKTGVDGRLTGDPKLVKVYSKYLKEYEDLFSETWKKTTIEVFGERPT